MKKILGLISLISFIIVLINSNAMVLDLPGDIENFFIKNENSDGILLNFAIGYLVSLIFYLIVVYSPEKKKKKRVEKIVLEEISGLFIDAHFLVINMYKNVCSKDEWLKLKIETDDQFFNEVFYERMKKFDGYSKADSLMMKEDDNGSLIPMNWDDRLENNFIRFVESLDNMLSTYVNYMDDDLLTSLIAFRNNRFITYYLGLYTNNLVGVMKGNNGIMYADRVGIALLRKDPKGKKSAIFSKINDVDNIEILKSYVDSLLLIRKYCLEKSGIDTDIGKQYFMENGCGQNEISKLK